MKIKIFWDYALILLLAAGACSKADFLDKKPSTNIVIPSTLNDFQRLLDNTNVLPFTGGLAQISADEYVVDMGIYNGASATERNAYIWSQDLYGGDQNVRSWNDQYAGVFVANNVLSELNKSDSVNSSQGRFIKGWALFSRAFAFYDLARSFCRGYDPGTANGDLGIPLKLSPNIDELEQRATLQQTYAQIFSDLQMATQLLPAARPSENLNRPSKIACYALSSRIYLDMRDYTKAGLYADSCLALYDKLIDYNLLNTSASVPFTSKNDEMIFNSQQVTAYPSFSSTSMYSVENVNSSLIELYNLSDLRLPLYYFKSGIVYRKKQGYNGDYGFYPFTGLATDEVYLIKAECLARKEEVAQAMKVLNDLLINRYETNSVAVPLTAISSQDALQKILLERRKELAFRGLRWYDLKRLNNEGANITLIRELNGTNYTLAPNSPKYVFPIPNDEIVLSGIQQNPR